MHLWIRLFGEPLLAIQKIVILNRYVIYWGFSTHFILPDLLSRYFSNERRTSEFIIHSVPFWGEDPFKRWHINHMVQIQCAFMNSIGRRQHIMLYILAPSWSISVKSHTLSISCDFSSYFNFISSLIVHRLSSMVFNLIIIFWRHLKSVSYVTVSITTVNFEAFWDSSSAHMYHTFWFISSLVT